MLCMCYIHTMWRETFKKLSFMCVLPTCMSMERMYWVPVEAKILESLVVSCQVSVRTGAWVLWKSSPCSYWEFLFSRITIHNYEDQRSPIICSEYSRLENGKWCRPSLRVNKVTPVWKPVGWRPGELGFQLLKAKKNKTWKGHSDKISRLR